jgi:hypothetical protein
MKNQIAIVSSGDPEKDALELAAAQLHQSRMQANICPNGCGAMFWDDPHTRHCPVCQFVGWCNTPHTEGEA